MGFKKRSLALRVRFVCRLFVPRLSFRKAEALSAQQIREIGPALDGDLLKARPSTELWLIVIIRTSYNVWPSHPEASPPLWGVLRFSVALFTSTKTVRTVIGRLQFNVALRPQRPYGLLQSDGERRAATSIFTRTAPAFWKQFEFNVALRPKKPYGLLQDGEHRTTFSTFTQLLTFTQPTIAGNLNTYD